VKILGGGNLDPGWVSDWLGQFHGAGHVREAVDTLARCGDLLKVRGEESHDVCGSLFTLV
jgi:hypothetical protein